MYTKNKILYKKLPKNVDDVKNILYNKKHNIGIKWNELILITNKLIPITN